MLYEIRMKDLRNEALAEGMAIGEAKGMSIGEQKNTINVLQKLMHNMGWSVDQAMDMIGTPEQERQMYKDILNKATQS